AEAGGLACLFPRLGEDREEDRRQNGNDRDHHEQLDESEPSLTDGSHFRLLSASGPGRWRASPGTWWHGRRARHVASLSCIAWHARLLLHGTDLAVRAGERAVNTRAARISAQASNIHSRSISLSHRLGFVRHLRKQIATRECDRWMNTKGWRS